MTSNRSLFLLALVFFVACDQMCDNNPDYWCPDGFTCCQRESGEYGCCPYSNAVCCPDHEHCCPQNYQCGNGRCYRDNEFPYPASSMRWTAFKDQLGLRGFRRSSGWEMILNSEFCLTEFLNGVFYDPELSAECLREKDVLVGTLRGLFYSLSQERTEQITDEITDFVEKFAKICTKQLQATRGSTRGESKRLSHREFEHILEEFGELSHSRSYYSAGEVFRALLSGKRRMY
eukprot:TRINITY_DN2625_c0_g2_i1.p1 TRINITY_DN2625_c0_g2~~TRINITY_DN2625_c0_g2_i1.p1  ORF type:complete len:232 (-),score=40.35 TRINITY_DN2625_c0_g2_i1:55-750(-)